ncbi:MAG: efflux RND transporter permease subunit [Leptospirales bacterium]
MGSEEELTPDSRSPRPGMAGWLARTFIHSRLTPIVVLVALLLGGLAVLVTPREEDPQIKVPMMDLFLSYPGASSKEMERNVTAPLERHLSRLKGVKGVYSSSRRGSAVVTVRFRVGQSMDRSIVKIYAEVMKSRSYLPSGVGPVIVRSKDINNVPILAVTLYSRTESDFVLRRLARRVSASFRRLPGTSDVMVIGGRERTIRVILDPSSIRAHHLSILDIHQALARSNDSVSLGSFDRNNVSFRVSLQGGLTDVGQVRNLVVGVWQGAAVHLGDVSEVKDGPGPVSKYVWMGRGANASRQGDFTAVTVAVAKKKGTNAVLVSHRILRKMGELGKTFLPADVHWSVTRNYGHTANEKANDLLKHLVIATVAVIVLIGIALGIRETGVVGVAIPVTLALTLFFSMMIGYTVNRVTLFALIFSIGILVDDGIVIVENIYRHFHFLGGKRDRTALTDRVIYAVNEVGNPTILATMTVIAALLPMAFVSGLMGPYMRPIPVNASMAMLGSLFVALVVTPYLAIRLIRPGGHHSVLTGKLDGWVRHLYHSLMRPLLNSGFRQNLFLGSVLVLTVGVMGFFYERMVLLKMLPFDNKSEIDVVIDMPAGTTLEETARATRELESVVLRNPWVKMDQAYVGTASPFDFNGLVRHYYLRSGKRVAELHINLLSKAKRPLQSHLIAEQLERALAPVARNLSARIKVVEVPPGPPVFAPITAEVYGPDEATIEREARRIETIFEQTPGIVDVDSSMESPQTLYRIRVRQEKSALSGVSTEEVARALSMGLSGLTGVLHTDTGKGYVPIVLEYPRDIRSSIHNLNTIEVRGAGDHLIPVSSLVRVEKVRSEQTLYRKDLRPVVYVTGNTIGSGRSPVYAAVDLSRLIASDAKSRNLPLHSYFRGYPFSQKDLSVRWGGEWHVTYITFRDMGLAFIAAIVLIYLLVVAEFESFVTPVIIMSPIPLALIGVIPGHLLFHSNFTATSMIGFIALGGIMVRNSILLVDFLHSKRDEGVPIHQAILEAGAVRTRPILLTAMALVVGSLVILDDPIFRGMAISLLSGSVVSTLLTLFVVPLLILRIEGRSWASKSVSGERGKR